MVDSHAEHRDCKEHTVLSFVCTRQKEEAKQHMDEDRARDLAQDMSRIFRNDFLHAQKCTGSTSATHSRVRAGQTIFSTPAKTHHLSDVEKYWASGLP